MPLTKEQKAAYDKQYRERNREKIKLKKQQAFQKDYKANPEKYRLIRQKKMAAHIEYCRKPEYRLYKKAYDRKLRFGEYDECQSIITQIEAIVKEHFLSPYERRKARGYYERSRPA